MKLLTITVALLASVAVPAVAYGPRDVHNEWSDHEDDWWTRGPDQAARSERPACSLKPATDWLSIAQITRKLDELRFRVIAIEATAGCYQARVKDAQGVTIELHIDAVTAGIVRRRDPAWPSM